MPETACSNWEVYFLESSTITLIITGVTIVCFITEVIPIAVTAISSALAMAIFGVISFGDAFSGFSHDVPMMLTGACILGEALFETGAAEKLGEIVVRIAGKNQKIFTAVMFLLSAVMSSLLSNTAVVAAMLPIISAAAATSKGKLTKKNTFMAVGIGANLGGSLTLAGSSTNMIGQGILAEAGVETMSFFDLTMGSIPRLIFCTLFYLTVGEALQNKVFSFVEVSETTVASQSETASSKSNGRMWLSIIILVGTIVGFATETWTFGTVAMVAGVLCIITKCISIKAVYQRMDWTTIWVVAGSLGFACGLDKSGAGKLIADTAIKLVGSNMSNYTFLILFSILSVLLANFMSSTATMAMLAPIGIFMARGLGFDPKALVMALVWCINLAFATPVGTPPITMTLSGGYSFKDYVKVGGILVVCCTVITILSYPLLFDLK